jgi:hypothetical protein
VARIEGSDPKAPTLCLMGHTDVVPVNPKTWTRDPFGGELVAGEVWGRGAVDMLNLTASQAVALKTLARRRLEAARHARLPGVRRRGGGRQPRRRPRGQPSLGRAEGRLPADRERRHGDRATATS